MSDRDNFGRGANQILRVELKGKRLVISIGVETLKVAAEGMPNLCHQMARLVVTDRDEFARSTLHALRREEEDGTTFVHEAIDKAFEYVIDQGLGGCDIEWPSEEELNEGFEDEAPRLVTSGFKGMENDRDE